MSPAGSSSPIRRGDFAASPRDVLTLAVASPTSTEFTRLDPDLLISDAPVGSGFVATVMNLGSDYTARTSGAILQPRS